MKSLRDEPFYWSYSGSDDLISKIRIKELAEGRHRILKESINTARCDPFSGFVYNVVIFEIDPTSARMVGELLLLLPFSSFAFVLVRFLHGFILFARIFEAGDLQFLPANPDFA